jgi:pimeloyl-ACP methyl ester carboxylesterase
MPAKKILLAAALLCASVAVTAQIPAAITTDPAPDKTYPAAMQSFQLPSHGELLNALVYVASGAGPHPIVILLHGFPGNEKNLDLAQAIRRAGWDVLFFNYRGSWGSPGIFSFTHAMEDTQAAVAYLRDPANAAKFRSDPKYIVLIGHSMGGMIAANVAASDPDIRAVGLISAANMAGRLLPAVKANQQEAALPRIEKGLAAEGMAPLAGCTPESLARELLANAAKWNIPDLAPKLSARPVLVVTSDDGLAPDLDTLVDNLKKLGDTEVNEVHIATDHAYSDHRIALQETVLNGLDHLESHR